MHYPLAYLQVSQPVPLEATQTLLAYAWIMANSGTKERRLNKSDDGLAGEISTNLEDVCFGSFSGVVFAAKFKMPEVTSQEFQAVFLVSASCLKNADFIERTVPKIQILYLLEQQKQTNAHLN